MKTSFEKPNSRTPSVDPDNNPLDLINISLFIWADVFKNTGEKMGYIKDISIDRRSGKINSFLVEIDESEKEITIPYYFLIFNSKNRVFILNKDLDTLNGDTKVEVNQFAEAYNPRIDHLYWGFMEG